jgi:hypothetical protein
MLGTGSTGTKVAAILLIALMAVGSVMMWLGVPFLWIWGVSQSVDTSQPKMGPYVLLLFGIPASMVVVGKLLGRLNRVYGEVTNTTPHVKVVLPWHRSMRDERDAHAPRTVLDVVMVCSVATATTLMAIWFFFFAEGGGI